MDLTRLKYFRAVAETVSIRKAADLLKVSSSALSKAVKQLERDLGMPLLTPAGRGITLTDAGRVAYEHACRILAGYDDLKAGVAQKADDRQQPVRFGSYSTFTTFFLGSFMRDVMPEARFLVRQTMPGELEHALGANLVDYGLTYMPVPDPKVKFIEAAQTGMAVYTRRGAFKGMPLNEIPAVAPTTAVGRGLIDATGFDGWPRAMGERAVKYHIEGLDAALEACRNGMCAGYFPTFLVALHNERVRPELALVPLVLPGKLAPNKLALYIVRRASDADDTVVRKLAKHLRVACRAEVR